MPSASHHFRVRALAGLLIGAGVGMFGAPSCKKKDGPTCNPDDKTFVVRVLIQPTDQLNPDDEDNPLPTVVRVYQLSGDTSLQMIDFKQVWEEGGKVAFGDEYISEEELTIYPERPDMLEIEPDAKASHFLAVAIFREPMGQSWYRVWEVPKYHGHSVCAAERKGKPLPDPCFFVYLDRNQADGGHTAPAGFDKSKAGVECPGPPLKTPPPEPVDKKKKKKKKKRKLKLEDAKKAEGAEAPSTPEAPSGPEAPSAPGG
jgi:type VI secretion system protein VasD